MVPPPQQRERARAPALACRGCAVRHPPRVRWLQWLHTLKNKNNKKKNKKKKNKKKKKMKKKETR